MHGSSEFLKKLQIKGENKYDMECLFKHELNFFFSIPSTKYFELARYAK